jgi:hypothetical protein
MDDLDRIILLQLSNVIRDVGDFSADLLGDDLTHDEQINFAHRLVDLAEAIRERATGEPEQLVIESAQDDNTPSSSPTRPALP